MGFEALKPAPGGAAEAQKALDKASGANRASALAALALALGAEGKFEDSLTRGLEALDLCEVQKDNKGKGCCFFAVARTHLLRGALAQAQQMSAAALKIFQEAKDGAWEEAAAKLLLAASVGKAGPGGAAAAAGACAGAAAAALLGAAERRRGSLLRIAEAKGLSSRGDHEAALKRVCDPYTLASGEPDDLTAETPMCPADLGIGLTPEVSAALSRAVEVLAKGGSAKEKAAAAEAKANVLAIQGGGNKPLQSGRWMLPRRQWKRPRLTLPGAPCWLD
ncbi:unnamed protein product [Effrenium voratum]|uniref:Uncharacterized protein n=1 Tax=Effrenium voratum TaxID=2562239 RepID=A0AA36IZ42_9DINO|nr:unnamed protein product [Effrenium voratum]